MSEETADKIIDAILEVFNDSEIPIMDKMTLFGRIQNVVYSEVTDGE